MTLPGAGPSGRSAARRSPEIWYSFSSPLTPSTVYVFDPATQNERRRSSRRHRPSTPACFETRALFATSKDGTRVPFFLTAKKDLARDGSNPTMLYGYGGFSVSMLPTYRPDVPAWLEPAACG